MKYRTMKRPKVGDYVILPACNGRVLSVHRHGRVLQVDAGYRGTERVRRMSNGNWAVVI